MYGAGVGSTIASDFGVVSSAIDVVVNAGAPPVYTCALQPTATAKKKNGIFH